MKASQGFLLRYEPYDLCSCYFLIPRRDFDCAAIGRRKALPARDSVVVDFQRDADLVLFFHPKNAKSISEKRFLNQHESGKSSGHFETALREKVENSIVGLSLDIFESKELRPKSALVIGTDSLSGVVTKYNASGIYGGAGAVLKSRVKRQTHVRRCRPFYRAV